MAFKKIQNFTANLISLLKDVKILFLLGSLRDHFNTLYKIARCYGFKIVDETFLDEKYNRILRQYSFWLIFSW